jgi:hypothetical protein
MMTTIRLTAAHLKDISTCAAADTEVARPKLWKVFEKLQKGAAFILLAMAALIVLNSASGGYRWIPISIVGVLLVPTVIVNLLKPEFSPALQKCLGQERVLTLSEQHITAAGPDIETRIVLDHISNIVVLPCSCVLALKSGGRVYLPVGPNAPEESARRFFAALKEKLGERG